jgi:hypothetical protein
MNSANSSHGPAGFLAAACIACAVCAAAWGLGGRRRWRRGEGPQTGGRPGADHWPGAAALLRRAAFGESPFGSDSSRSRFGTSSGATSADDARRVALALPRNRAEQLAMAMALEEASVPFEATDPSYHARSATGEPLERAIFVAASSRRAAARALLDAGFPASLFPIPLPAEELDPEVFGGEAAASNLGGASRSGPDRAPTDDWIAGGERLRPGHDGETARNAMARARWRAGSGPAGAYAAGDEAALDDPAAAAPCYCPRCAAAYVDEAGGCDYCPGVELVNDPPDPAALGEWTVVARLSTWSERERLRLLLASANIPVRAEAWDTLGMGAASGLDAYALLVPAHCLERARDVAEG